MAGDADVQRAYDAARRTWPGVDLALADFAAAFARAEERGGAPPVAPDDLYVAVACERRAAGAWEGLAERFGPRLRALLLARSVAPAAAEEAVGDLLGYVCEPPADARAATRIGTFGGTGRLFSWLAVLLLRRRAAAAPPETAAPLEDVSAPGATPLGAIVRADLLRRVQEALAVSWGDLTPRERLVVLWKYRDGLKQREIARLLGVGEPRASRLVAAGIARLREAVALQLAEESPEDLAALWPRLRSLLAARLASSGDGAHSLPERA